MSSFKVNTKNGLVGNVLGSEKISNTRLRGRITSVSHIDMEKLFLSIEDDRLYPANLNSNKSYLGFSGIMIRQLIFEKYLPSIFIDGKTMFYGRDLKKAMRDCLICASFPSNVSKVHSNPVMTRFLGWNYDERYFEWLNPISFTNSSSFDFFTFYFESGKSVTLNESSLILGTQGFSCAGEFLPENARKKTKTFFRFPPKYFSTNFYSLKSIDLSKPKETNLQEEIITAIEWNKTIKYYTMFVKQENVALVSDNFIII